MAAGDRIIIGIATSELYLQESTGFERNDYGFDTGTRVFEIYGTGGWPVPGQSDITHPNMYVVKVKDTLLESGMYRLDVSYKGYVGGVKPDKILLNGDSQSFTVGRFVFPVPVPTCTRIYLSSSPPNFDGIGQETAQSFLPSPGDWSVSITTSEELPLNVLQGWVYESVSDDNAAGQMWEITERYRYYYPIG